eukprot:1132511-Prymnesium_polylepis.1
MEPPPRPKRVSRVPQAATAAAAPTTLMPQPHSNAWASGRLSTGCNQQATAAAACSANREDYPSLAPRARVAGLDPSRKMPPPPPRKPSRGEMLVATAAASAQIVSGSEPSRVIRAIETAIGSEMSCDVSPARTLPDLMGSAAKAATAISQYQSPRTQPRELEPATTRSSETLKDTTMGNLTRRLEVAGVTTRAQERVSKAEQRAWAAEQKRESRVRLKYEEESCAELMADLA